MVPRSSHKQTCPKSAAGRFRRCAWVLAALPGETAPDNGDRVTQADTIEALHSTGEAGA